MHPQSEEELLMIYYNSSYIYVSGVKLFKLSSSNDDKYNVAVTTV